MCTDSCAASPLPGLQFLEVRERFLPVKQAVLRERMLRDPRLSVREREQLGQLFEMIAARFHFEFRAQLEHLKDVYDPFDPDAEAFTSDGPADGAPTDDAAQRAELVRVFEQMLLEANYVEMPHEQVITCAEYQSQVGLVVQASLADYAELRVFYRGMRHEQRTFRPWLAAWKRQTETVHVFSRLAMLVRLSREPSRPVFLKLFKNVVAEDLEMLLPYVRIRMRLLDHLKIGSSVAGGAATAAWKAFTAAILSPEVFLLLLTGFTVALVRGVFSFFSSKARYMQTLTSRLYFQNLANNSSALAHLIDAAEAEECKELLAAYYILYVERDCDYTQEQLDRRVEEWLRTEFNLQVDFEVSDAGRKLCEKGLMVRRTPLAAGRPAAESVLKVYDLPSALRRLDETWDGYYRDNGTRSPGEDRLADGDWPPYPEAVSAPSDAAPTRRMDWKQTLPAPATVVPETKAAADVAGQKLPPRAAAAAACSHLAGLPPYQQP
jgi:hypothetical protein